MAYDLFNAMAAKEQPAGDSLVNQSSGYDLFGRMNGAPLPSGPAKAATPSNWFNEGTAAFSRGFDELQQMGYGAGALAASWIGWDGARDAFMKGYDYNTKQIEQNPETVKSYEDINDFDSAIRYGASAIGGFAPLVGQSLATGVIGAAIGTSAEPGGGTVAGGVAGLVARKAVKNLLASEVKNLIGEGVTKELGEYVAGKVSRDALSAEAKSLLTKPLLDTAKQFGSDAAVGLANIGIMTGSLYGEMANDPDIPESDKRLAATIGGFLAAVPMTSVAHTIGKAFNPGATDAFIKSAVGEKEVAEQAGYTARMMTVGGKEMMKNFGHTGSAMFVQTAINIAAKKWADPDKRWDFLNYSPTDWQSMIDSTIKGGIGGAFIGGPIATLGHMANHPNPEVRSDMRDVLLKADDVKVSNAEETPESIELDKVQGRIGMLEASINGGKLSPEDMQAHQEELAGHKQNEEQLLQKLGFENPNAPLVNKEAAAQEEAKPEPIKPNEDTHGSTHDEKLVESLRAFYGDKMPSGESPTEQLPGIEDKAKDRETENAAHIQSIAAGTEYGAKLTAAITPDITRMMAAENIHLATDETENNHYAANIDNNGKIHIFVPKADFIEKEAEARSGGMGGDSEKAKSDVLNTVEAAVAHEVIHAADLVNIRDQHSKLPEEGRPSLVNYKSQVWKERGARFREAFPDLPKIAKAAYHWGKIGQLSDEQLGAELPRMAAEIARRGKTTEVTEALQDAARNNGKLNAHLRDWINALKTIGAKIGSFLDPKAGSPELLKIYHDIKGTLDKYGALVNQTEPEKVSPKVEEVAPIVAKGKYERKFEEIKSGTAPDAPDKRAYQLGVIKSPEDLQRWHQGLSPDLHRAYEKARKENTDAPSSYKAAFDQIQKGDIGDSLKMKAARVAFEHDIIKSPEDLQKWMNGDHAMHKKFGDMRLAKVQPEIPAPVAEKAPEPPAPEPKRNKAKAPKTEREKKRESNPDYTGVDPELFPKGKFNFTPTDPSVLDSVAKAGAVARGEVLPAQQAESLVNQKVPNKYQEFRKTIKTSGPSDAVRSYLDWQDSKGQMPGTAAEVRLAHQDFMSRASNSAVTLDRFKALVKEKKAEQNAKILEDRKSNQPAQKASIFNADETADTGREEHLSPDAGGARGYHTPIARKVAEASSGERAGGKLRAVRSVVERDHPLLIPHFENIVREVQAHVGKEETNRWSEAPEPVRGSENAQKIREYNYAMFVDSESGVSELSSQLGEERGIVLVGRPEDIPTDHYIIDTSANLKDHPLLDEETSVKEPVENTNKLKEAQMTAGIPETHPVTAFSEHPLSHDLMKQFDDHFGENRWIMKNYGDDANKSKGVVYADALKGLTDVELAKADTSVLMVQELHNISDSDRSSNVKIWSGNELRVHVITDQNGTAHISPFSTFWKLTGEEAEATPIDRLTPIMIEGPEIQAAHAMALDAIHSLPESERTGQFYGLDIVKTKDGWGVIELNPTDSTASSSFFQASALAHESYMAALMGERPLHAELASVVHDAIRGDSVQPKEDPFLVNQNDAAQKPSLSKTVQTRVDRIMREVNDVSSKTINDLEEAKSETKKGGNVGEYSHLVGFENEYESQPKARAEKMAQDVMDEKGLDEVAHTLLQDPSGMSYKLNDYDELENTPGGGLRALYDITKQQIDTLVQKLETEPGGPMRTVKNYWENIHKQLEKNGQMLGRALGRASSMSHEVDVKWNAETGRRTYSEPIIAHLEKVLGKKGARFVSILTDHLNELMASAAGRAVEKSPVIAELARIAKLAHTRAFQNEARKTAFSTERRVRSYVRNMAARAAAFTAQESNGKDQLAHAAQGIIKNISGLVKVGDAKTETQIFNTAVAQVARDNASALGMLNENKTKPISTEEKFAAIMKNPEMYQQFADVLHYGIIKEYKPEPGSPFAEKVADLRSYMLDRQWSQGMVESLVNKNLKGFETTFTKIAKDHYGATEFHADAMKAAVHDAMREHGVDNIDLVDKLMEDVDGDFKSRTEQARLDFFGSNAGVREFLRHMQATLAEKAKEHALTKSDIPDKLGKWLAEDFGLPDTAEMPIASSLQEVMTRQFNQMLAEERPKLIEQMLKKATDGKGDAVKAKAMQAVDKIVQLVNLGLFRNEDAYNALAPKFGLPKFDPAVAARAEELGARLATAENPRMKDDYKQELSILVGSQKGITPYDMFMAGLYVNMLSGPSTLGVHNSSEIASVAGHMLVNAVQYRKTIPQQLRAAFISMTGPALTEAREVLSTGNRLSRFGDKYFGEDNPLEMESPIFKSNISSQLDFGTRGEPLGDRIQSLSERGATLMHRVYRRLGAKYIGRILSAADAFYYKIAQDVSFAAKTGIVENEEMRRSAMDQARKQMLDQGDDPDTSKALKLKQHIYANRIVNDQRLMVGGEMDENLRLAWVESHNEAMDITFKQDPKGLLGRFSKAIESWAQGEKEKDGKGRVPNPLGKMLIPFTRIAANVTNQMLEWTPYGLVRWGVGHLYGEDFRLRDEDGKVVGRDPKVAIRAILGMTGMMGLAMTMSPKKEDEADPFFALYDEGPKNPQARKQLMDRGWRPKTFKVGGSYFTYSTTPFAMAFAVMGRMFDNAREGKEDDNGLASSAVAMLQTVTHESFLSSLTDFMSAVDSPNPEAKMANMMARMASTPFIPNLAKQIDKWVDPSIQESQGFTENFLKNFPVVRHSLNPALNYFGHELKHQPGIDLPGTERFLTMEKTDDPVLNMGSEKGVIFPGFSKSTKLGDVPMTHEQYYHYVKTAGPQIESEIKANIPQIRALDREHAQERVNEIVRKVKEKVRNQMRDGLVN